MPPTAIGTGQGSRVPSNDICSPEFQSQVLGPIAQRMMAKASRKRPVAVAPGIVPPQPKRQKVHLVLNEPLWDFGMLLFSCI